MVTPLRHSAVCWTTDPRRVAGPVAPASGILTSSAGTRYWAQSIRFSQVISDHRSGGEGQTSKTAIGRSARASSLPATTTSRSFITSQVSTANAPVTTGLRVWSRVR